MVVKMNIRIENLNELRANFNKAPQLSLKYLSQAVAASIFEVEKQAVDRNFQFKTPRSGRTGFLQSSFSQGKQIKGLKGAIGPTTFYSPFVYFGTSRGIAANPFMDRIAEASEDSVTKHFKKAIDLFLRDIAKT